MQCQSSPATRVRFSPVRYRAHPNVPSYADCVYCGEPAESRDHFVPLSLVSKWPRVLDSRHVRRLLFTVPACMSCNSTARDRAFRTFEAKREYIRSRISARHRKAIQWCGWGPEDYNGAGYKLRKLAKSVDDERARTLRRVGYECPYDITPLPGAGGDDDGPQQTSFVASYRVTADAPNSFPSRPDVKAGAGAGTVAPDPMGNARKQIVRRQPDPICTAEPDRMVTLPQAARLIGRRHYAIRDVAADLPTIGAGKRGSPVLYRLGDIVARMENQP